MWIWFLLVGALILYPLPGIIAVRRKHTHTKAIWVVNILLGWTFAIWVICLAWSLLTIGASHPTGGDEPRGKQPSTYWPIMVGIVGLAAFVSFVSFIDFSRVKTWLFFKGDAETSSPVFYGGVVPAPERSIENKTQQVLEYVTAPGGKTTYYVMTEFMPQTKADPDPYQELIEVTDNRRTVLVTSKDSSTMADQSKIELVRMESLKLSPDSKHIYFMTDSWATSGALHTIDLTTRRLSFVAPAGVYCVVLSGEYQGDLVLSQHRYHVQGGSYDNLYLYTPDGKELGTVSQNEDDTVERFCTGGLK